MFERAYSIVKDRVDTARTGTYFFGFPRLGKTSCAEEIKELLKDDFPTVYIHRSYLECISRFRLASIQADFRGRKACFSKAPRSSFIVNEFNHRYQNEGCDAQRETIRIYAGRISSSESSRLPTAFSTS
jgi:hypothetical protein